MKKLLVLSMLLASVSSFAGTGFTDHPSEVAGIDQGQPVCIEVAMVNMINFAHQNGLNSVKMSDLETARLVGNDRRMLSPSHYSWYEMDLRINGEVKTIRTMVQYNRLNKTCR